MISYWSRGRSAPALAGSSTANHGRYWERGRSVSGLAAGALAPWSEPVVGGTYRAGRSFQALAAPADPYLFWIGGRAVAVIAAGQTYVGGGADLVFWFIG